MTDPKQPREFSDFSSGQDGWGNSILDEPRVRIPEDDEQEPDELFPNENENTVTIENKNDGSINCTNEGDGSV